MLFKVTYGNTYAVWMIIIKMLFRLVRLKNLIFKIQINKGNSYGLQK